MEDKIIVSNRQTLTDKYGSKGMEAISNALETLIKSDDKRGLKTSVVYIDDKPSMKRFRGRAASKTGDPRQNKESIDAVFKFFNPHYLMILGSTDIVPHQDLQNPVYDPKEDDDVYALGDLPYACDAPYSQDPSRFVGPSRVVGRLPDLVGASEPSYLLSLLRTAADYQSRPLDYYADYFGLSAEVWKQSTRTSLRSIFGNASELLLAPPSGPDYSNDELHNHMHFINCHGGSGSPEFYGQQDDKYPITLTSRATAGQIHEGTVAAVECCYGAQLYDSVTLGIDLPICQSYLMNQAYAYFGSTTIAYGPSEGNASADLICQYFLSNVLRGSSTGLAALLACQQFVNRPSPIDPIDLKTLCQFCLLGDPSIHPLIAKSPTAVPRGVDRARSERFFRTARRNKLRSDGEFLASTQPVASKRMSLGRLSAPVRASLSEICSTVGLRGKQTFTAFGLTGGHSARRTLGESVPSRYLVTLGTPEGQRRDRVKNGVAVVAEESDGRIIGYRIYYQR